MSIGGGMEPVPENVVVRIRYHLPSGDIERVADTVGEAKGSWTVDHRNKNRVDVCELEVDGLLRRERPQLDLERIFVTNTETFAAKTAAPPWARTSGVNAMSGTLTTKKFLAPLLASVTMPFLMFATVCSGCI
jgi:hypothetical protein